MTVTAPATINTHDSSKYKVSYDDNPAISFKSEDATQTTRPRYTKAPAKTHAISFTFVTNDVKEAIEQLWVDAKGSSEIIIGFIDPIKNVPLEVRFKGPMPSFNYKGRGGVHYWDITNIVFVEV